MTPPRDDMNRRMHNGINGNYYTSPSFQPKLRNWTLKGIEEQFEDAVKRANENNPFTKIHTTKEGDQVMIAAMEASHLVNTVRFLLVKFPEEQVKKARVDAMGAYAPSGMDERVARTMNLYQPSRQELDEIEAQLVQLHSCMVSLMLEKATPYIVVGVARVDTMQEIVTILRDVTGIYERVEYQRPSYNERQLSSSDALNIDEDELPDF